MSLPIPSSQEHRSSSDERGSAEPGAAPQPRGDRPRVERLEVRRSEPEVYRVTSAKTGLSEEQRYRTKRYLISMSIRTACFLAAVVASGWLRWAFLVGAVVLPYVAVIMANAGRENDPFPGPEPVSDLDLRQIPHRQSDGGS